MMVYSRRHTHTHSHTESVTDSSPRMYLVGNDVLLSHISDCCHRMGRIGTTVFPAPRWRKSLDKAPRLFAGSLPGFRWEGKSTGHGISPCARRPFEGQLWYKSDVILFMVKKAIVACPEDEVISLSLIPVIQEMGFVRCRTVQ